MERDRRAQWLRGVLDLCVLGALTHGESYGYEIARRLDTGGIGPIAGGTLYPTLLRLERLGLIDADWRYYRLSHEGHRVLRASSADWSLFVDQVNALMKVAG